MTKAPALGIAAALLVAPALVLPLTLPLGVGLLTGAATTQPCGPAGPARSVAGTDLDAEQLANAATILAATAARTLPRQAGLVAVATTLQESSLRNLPTGDRDSLGLFQQRASWGPAAVRLDPAAATGLFLDALQRVPGWEALPVAVASDRVQHSAHPWAVARWEPVARLLVATYWPRTPSTSSSSTSSSPSAAGTGPAANAPVTAAPVDQAQPAGACAGQGSDGMSLTGTAAIPAGYHPPTTPAQAAVTRFALAQLGKPYRWGATGPDSWDCSGLTMRAWAAAGVALPRTTFQQVLVGAPVASTGALQPGDLIFIAGLDGTPANPGHVGLFLGDLAGAPSLVHAPRTGKSVEIQPLTAWHGQIVAIRRPPTPANS